jgi:hypothetical protein
MIGAKKQLIVMWNINDLEWKEYLANNNICYYIQYYMAMG